MESVSPLTEADPMNNTTSQLRNLKSWALARSPREITLLAASVVALVFFFADRLMYSPQNRRLIAAEQQVQSAQSMLLAAQSVLRGIESGAATGEAKENLPNLVELRKQARLIDSVIGDSKGSPSSVSVLVKKLIATQHPRVNLLSLKTLPAKSLAASGQSPSSAKGGQQDLFRHGVELELGGAYLDLVAYLRSLEAGSQGLLWSDARLVASNFPEVTLRVTIYILSNRPDAFIS